MSFFLFILFSGIFSFFIPLTITSGDGAELVTVITLNGIAHPSGYPLYIILSKLFTFIPIGSIPFRISLFSIVCSVGSLLIIYNLVFKITNSKISGIFSAVSLFLSYSYFYQSLFQKFYTFNLFIILILILIGLTYINNFDFRIGMLGAFLLGLCFANHHTGLLMFFPFLYLFFLDFRKNIRKIIFYLIMFFWGAMVNFYIYIKLATKKFTFFPMEPTIKNVIYKYIFRGIYPKSSLETINSLSSHLKGFYFSFLNCFKIIQVNFPLYFTWIFFVLGIIFIFRKNRNYGFFLGFVFFIYSIFLAKLTFSKEFPTVFNYYIIANQYFLPMLAFFSIFSGIGFYVVLRYFSEKEYKIVKYLFFSLPFFYFIIFPQRIVDNLWSNNFVLYQARIDKLSTKPIDSVYITTGDNTIFQTAYLKKIGNFRNDVCQILLISNKEKGVPINCFLQGKRITEYKRINVENFILKNYDYHLPIVYSFKDFSNIFKSFYFVKFLSDYLLINKSLIFSKNNEQFYPENNKNSLFVKKEFLKKINKLKKIFCSFYNYLPCLNHSTDDYFTMGACFNTYIKNECIPENIKLKLLKYNTAPMPYIYIDSNLKKNFSIYDEN